MPTTSRTLETTHRRHHQQTNNTLIYSITVLPDVFYYARTDLRPIDGSRCSNHCLVFTANYIQAQLTVD